MSHMHTFMFTVVSFIAASSALPLAATPDWACDDCQCVSDNPRLFECCNDANMTDCYQHLKWGDKADCQAFCKPALSSPPPSSSDSSAYRLSEFFNLTKPGPGCKRTPVCQYIGALDSCAKSTDGLCTDIKVHQNTNGTVAYERFWATRDGSCKGPSVTVLVGPADDGTCHSTNADGWFVTTSLNAEVK